MGSVMKGVEVFFKRWSGGISRLQAKVGVFPFDIFGDDGIIVENCS